MKLSITTVCVFSHHGEGAKPSGVQSDLHTAAASTHGIEQAGAAGPHNAMHADSIATHPPMQDAHVSGPASTDISLKISENVSSTVNRTATLVLFPLHNNLILK